MPSLVIGINDLLTVDPQLAEEWNYRKNRNLKPNEIAAGSQRKIWWVCDKGHEWQATPNNRRYGNGCPYCSGRLPIVGETDLETVHPEIAKEWDYQKNGALTPKDVTHGSSKKVWWKCIKGHEWQTTIAHRASGQRCPVCSAEITTSFPEQAILYYVKAAFPDAINRYRPKWLLGLKNNQSEIDIYIPSRKIGIEYDGQVFHQSIERDKKKDQIVEQHNIHLIRVREPLCPRLDSTSTCIHIKETDSRFYFENAIRELLCLLNKKCKISHTGDIDIQRDYIQIQSSYEHIIKAKSVANVDAHLLKEWNYDKNGTLTPDNISYGSAAFIWWKCNKCGYEWQDTPKHRHRGRGCPKCAKEDRIKTRTHNMVCEGRSLHEWCNNNGAWGEQLLKEWHPQNDTTTQSITYGSNKKMLWQCERGHEWQATVANRTKGNKCPYCANKATLAGYNDLATVHPELIEEWLFSKNDIFPSSVRSGSNKKVWWKCRTCGNEWQAIICNRTGKNRSGCPVCAGKKIVVGVNDIGTTHGYLLEEWDFEKNKINPTSLSHGSRAKAWWVCSKCGHRWQSAICDRTAGHGCLKCAKRQAGKKRKRIS